MEENEIREAKSSKKTEKVLANGQGTLPRRRRRKGSLQLPKGVRVRNKCYLNYERCKMTAYFNKIYVQKIIFDKPGGKFD